MRGHCRVSGALKHELLAILSKHWRKMMIHFTKGGEKM
jgi:hypothetical protein